MIASALNAVVAPFVGAWIEISAEADELEEKGVAPFVGAWIEILMSICPAEKAISRSLRGSVD